MALCGASMEHRAGGSLMGRFTPRAENLANRNVELTCRWRRPSPWRTAIGRRSDGRVGPVSDEPPWRAQHRAHRRHAGRTSKAAAAPVSVAGFPWTVLSPAPHPSRADAPRGQAFASPVDPAGLPADHRAPSSSSWPSHRRPVDSFTRCYLPRSPRSLDRIFEILSYFTRPDPLTWFRVAATVSANIAVHVSK
jgi:hypothetical protein